MRGKLQLNNGRQSIGLMAGCNLALTSDVADFEGSQRVSAKVDHIFDSLQLALRDAATDFYDSQGT